MLRKKRTRKMLKVPHGSMCKKEGRRGESWDERSLEGGCAYERGGVKRKKENGGNREGSFKEQAPIWHLLGETLKTRVGNGTLGRVCSRSQVGNDCRSS